MAVALGRMAGLAAVAVVVLLVASVEARSKYDNPSWANTSSRAGFTDPRQYDKYPASHVGDLLESDHQPPRAGMLNIFVVPHSHDDVGWLETPFGYFNDTVQYVLTTVTQTLAKDPRRRFIWSEIKWFEVRRRPNG